MDPAAEADTVQELGPAAINRAATSLVDHHRQGETRAPSQAEATHLGSIRAARSRSRGGRRGRPEKGGAPPPALDPTSWALAVSRAVPTVGSVARRAGRRTGRAMMAVRGTPSMKVSARLNGLVRAQVRGVLVAAVRARARAQVEARIKEKRPARPEVPKRVRRGGARALASGTATTKLLP